MNNKNFFILICILTFSHNKTYSQVIFVNQKAVGIANGSNWTNAYIKLQDALSIAEYGDSIWVAKGVYTPNQSDQDHSFYVPNGVTLLGGFIGTETKIGQRNFEENETILSGERGDTSLVEDNHFNVLSMTNVDNNTVLDGFIITKGYANNEVAHFRDHTLRGGGLFIENTIVDLNVNPQIKNCIFIRNTGYLGGAIYMGGDNEEYMLSPIIEDCLFYKNTAIWKGGSIYKIGGGTTFIVRRSQFIESKAIFQFGAGILFRNAYGENIIEDCLFERDSCIRSEGGGIFYETTEKNSTLKLMNTRFKDNYTSAGGPALRMFGNGTFGKQGIHRITIQNCDFDNNFSYLGSGGVLRISNDWNKYIINIENCNFRNNYARNGGGSIYSQTNYDSTLFNIKNCVFQQNSSVNGVDGNIFLRPTAVERINYHRLELSNSLITNNAGAVSVFTGSGSANTIITNCTFYKNGLSPISKNWSADFDGITRYNNMKIVNSIFYEEPKNFNNATPPMEEIFFNNNLDSLHLADYQFENCWINALPITACDTTCGKNLLFNQYPLFTNPEAGDFSLIPCSPAVNAGRNMAGFSATDLVGNTRIKGNIIDIGAYESDAYEQITIDAEQTNASSGTSLDGALTIESISGGTPPYQYNWNNGETTNAIQNLNPNKYDLTITDSMGCSEVFEFEISFTNSIASNEDAFSSIVYPNPVFNNIAHIKIISSKTENLNIHTYDVMGRLINSQAVAVKRGNNVHALEMPKTKGFYLLAIRDTNNNLLSFHKIQLL